MKILHVCAGWEDTNGAAVIARRIAERQSVRGDEVSFATWASPAALRRADEVWTHCGWLPCLWWAGLFARRLVRMPEACYDPVRLKYSAWKKRLVRSFERLFLRKAARVVATCAAEKGWIEKYEPKAKAEVVDIRGFGWGPKVIIKVRPKLSISAAAPRVLYMGRRHQLKGVRFLEEATRRLGFELRVVSDARGEEKEAAFDWCDVFCLPTLSENFGIVVAEALSRGKKVVTTDGAPAWEDGAGPAAAPGAELVYLKGYLAAGGEERVAMLADALASAAGKKGLEA